GAVGGLGQEHGGDQADDRGEHQVEGGQQQIAGLLDQPGGDGGRQARDDDGDVEGGGQRAVAAAGGEQGRQGGGHDPGHAVQQHGQDHRAQQDPHVGVAGDQAEGGHRHDQQAYAAGQQEGLGADLVADEAHDRLHEQHAYHDLHDDQHAVL